MHHAPVLVLISAVGDGDWNVEDCSLAAQNLMLAAYAHPVALASLEAGRFIVAEEEKPRVTFGPGVELWLSLVEPLQISGDPEPEILREPAILRRSPELATLVNGLPLRTSTRAGYQQQPERSLCTRSMLSD